ncbi:unnamed protein product, partial [Nesidiocoris tenuis]
MNQVEARELSAPFGLESDPSSNIRTDGRFSNMKVNIHSFHERMVRRPKRIQLDANLAWIRRKASVLRIPLLRRDKGEAPQGRLTPKLTRQDISPAFWKRRQTLQLWSRNSSESSIDSVSDPRVELLSENVALQCAKITDTKATIADGGICIISHYVNLPVRARQSGENAHCAQWSDAGRREEILALNIYQGFSPALAQQTRLSSNEAWRPENAISTPAQRCVQALTTVPSALEQKLALFQAPLLPPSAGPLHLNKSSCPYSSGAMRNKGQTDMGRGILGWQRTGSDDFTVPSSGGVSKENLSFSKPELLSVTPRVMGVCGVEMLDNGPLDESVRHTEHKPADERKHRKCPIRMASGQRSKSQSFLPVFAKRPFRGVRSSRFTPTADRRNTEFVLGPKWRRKPAPAFTHLYARKRCKFCTWILFPVQKLILKLHERNEGIDFKRLTRSACCLRDFRVICSVSPFRPHQVFLVRKWILKISYRQIFLRPDIFLHQVTILRGQ